MSEHLSTAVSLNSSVAPGKRTERRQVRRAGISLQIRVRSADFNDGNFDEVQLTQNASRKAIYFFTKLDRYYKGMRVRVTSPYEPNAGSTNLEQVGEVARVHRRDEGYGVAVMILAGAQLTDAQKFSSIASKQVSSSLPLTFANSAPGERRCATRSPFIAPVELVEMRTGSCIQARSSDLSLQGCYIDTLNPLPVGAAVRLQIHRSGAMLDVLANVSSRHAGSGMGLVFSEITQAQRAVVENWLNELGLARTVFENPFPATKASLVGSDCAVRLVQMLLRKGVLSQSEASEVLSECGA
jgi:hypothetical protein